MSTRPSATSAFPREVTRISTRFPRKLPHCHAIAPTYSPTGREAIITREPSGIFVVAVHRPGKGVPLDDYDMGSKDDPQQGRSTRRFRRPSVSPTAPKSVRPVRTSTKPPSSRGLSPIEKAAEAGLLHVVFQPVVDLKTGKPFAFEALVRSKSPDFPNPHAILSAAID